MFCPICGYDLSPEAKECPACGTPIFESAQPEPAMPEPAMPETSMPDFPTSATPVASGAPSPKAGNKLPVIIIAAVVLVIAFISGIVALAATNKSEVKVFNAIKNTVFNASEYEIKFKTTFDDEDGEYITGDINITVGDDINSSVFKLNVKEIYESYYDSYYDYDDSQTETYEWNASIKDGKIYEDGEEEGTVSEYLKDIEEELEEEFDINVNLEEEINNILNGKIDEKALEKAYNEIVAPAIEKMLKEETDSTIELPDYEEVFGTATKLFKDKDVRKALAFEKTKSDLPGTTYEYSIDLGDLAEAALNYAQEDKKYSEYLEIVADEMDCDVDELIDEIVDELNEYEDITGTITVKSKKITNVTIEFYEYNIEIEINSKK